MDETTFINQAILPKSWAPYRKHNEHWIDSERMNVTVFGAIGSCLKSPVYMLADTTNAHNFKMFVKRIHENVKFGIEIKPLLVYDGHPAHRSHQSRAVIAKYFTDFLNVPYSCNFNAIEKVWFVAKRQMLKKLLLIPDIDKNKFMDIVWNCLHDIPPQTIRGLLRSNLAYIRKYLE